MTAQNMLRALGYTTSSSGVSSFQRDYNRVGTEPLLVTGELDEDTADAIRFAYGSREVFEAVREQKGK